MFVLKDNIIVGYSLRRVVLIDLKDQLKTKYLNTKSSFILYSLLNFNNNQDCINFLTEFSLFQNEQNSDIENDIISLKNYLENYLTYSAYVLNENDSKNINLKRLLESDSVKLRNKFRLDYPVKLVWIPTWKCNKNCLYCGVKKIGPAEPETQIPVSIIYERFQEAIDNGVKEVSIHGGDPLFCYNDEIYNIINFLTRNQIDVNISTKNHISLDKAKKLKNSGLKKVQLSIDTIDEKLCKLLYNDTKYVEQFGDSVKNLKTIGIEPTINIVLSTINYKGIIDLLNYLKSLDIQEITISNFRKGPINTTDYSINIEQQKWLFSEFTKNINNLNFKKLSYSPFDPELKSAKEKAICESCRVSLVIVPDGRICYCDFLTTNDRFLFGNLNNQTIKEIWECDELNTILSPSKKQFEGSNCIKCSSFDECIERGLCFLTSDSIKIFSPDYKSIECHELVGDNYGLNIKR